ncbi:MAG TPA: RHS repeat-associated core domain-containing protein [Clostridia bacterium]|nr:RHS repeat-associated core domain-containing protein [Clostridia bacterium]
MGNLQRVSYGNGLTNRYQYDVLNRLTNLTWKVAGAYRADFSYQLGLTGQRTNLSETVNNASRVFNWSYDKLYRLTNETLTGAAPAGSLTYAHDPVGNRTNRTGSLGGLGSQSLTYTTNDWVASDVYDANGNTRTNGSNWFEYDVENRLVSANVNGAAISIVYNGDGERVAKTVNGQTVRHLVTDRNPTGYAQVLEELNSAGELQRRYGLGHDLISQSRWTGSAWETHFYGYDGHGSVRFLAGTTGAVTDTYTYDAYGTLITSTGSTPNLYRYTGERWDPDLEMYYLRARYYNPQVGRFWTMDNYEGHKKEPISLHKYLYCHANPISNVDPSGRDVYVVTRPLNVDLLKQFPNLGVHVYLAFDTTGLTDLAAWEDAVRESCNAASHPSVYPDPYTINASLVTFSFHPRSVVLGDENENSAANIITPGSYVAYSDKIDLRAFNNSGDGYKRYVVATGQEMQTQIYQSAVRSRDLNNSGTPHPYRYESTFNNCGTWVDFILRNNGIAFPDRTINQGVGLRGTASSGEIAVNAITRGWLRVKGFGQQIFNRITITVGW